MTALVLACAVVLAYTYVGYPILIGALARLFPRRLRPFFAVSGGEPTVSVCIPAYNAADTLDAKLASVLEQDWPTNKLQVLVYSDGSTDDTDRLVGAWVARDKRVRLVRGNLRRGKPTGLNHLRVLADGELLVFTDARQRLERGTLRSLVEPLADPEVGCVTGNLVLEGGEGAGLYWRYENWIRRQEGRFHGVVGITGPLAAMRKADYELMPADIILDDVWIPMRLRLRGKRVVLSEEAVLYDRAFADGREFRRKVRTLAGNYQIFRRMPALLSPLLNPSWFETVSHKVMRLFCPWALVTMLAASVAGLVRSPSALVWQVLVSAQLAFYLTALLGPRAGRVAAAVRTFVVLHAAAVVGLWRFLRGRQPITW